MYYQRRNHNAYRAYRTRIQRKLAAIAVQEAQKQLYYPGRPSKCTPVVAPC